MKNKRDLIGSESNLQLFFIGILLLGLAFYQPLISIIGFIILGYLIFRNIKSAGIEKKKFIKYIEGLSDEFDSATKHATFNMPFPLVILDDEAKISWYNTPFLKMMNNEELLIINPIECLSYETSCYFTIDVSAMIVLLSFIYLLQTNNH